MGPMDHATTELYELSPTPILYVGPCDLILGGVPRFPLFLRGNATPTMPHKLRHLNLKGSAFQFGHASADAPSADGSRGATCTRSTHGCAAVAVWARVRRGRPRIGSMSVSEIEGRRNAVNREEESRDPPSPRGSQAQSETCGRSASEVISQDNPV